MQASSMGTGAGRSAEGSPAQAWGGEYVPCPLICRAVGVDVSLMLTDCASSRCSCCFWAGGTSHGS